MLDATKLPVHEGVFRTLANERFKKLIGMGNFLSAVSNRGTGPGGDVF